MDAKWLQGEFLTTVAGRGAAIIAARGECSEQQQFVSRAVALVVAQQLILLPHARVRGFVCLFVGCSAVIASMPYS